MTLPKKELRTHKHNIELELDKINREYDKSNTNHILHLILSVFSGGIWLIVWFFVARGNSIRRAKLEKLMDESRTSIAQIEDSIDDL